MAYEKTTWKSGDVVTSAKLNNIENGIANSNPLICDFVYEEGSFSKLNQKGGDVYTAFLNGRPVLLRAYDDETETEEAVRYCKLIMVGRHGTTYTTIFAVVDLDSIGSDVNYYIFASPTADDYLSEEL